MKLGILACSNPIQRSAKRPLAAMCKALEEEGHQLLFSSILNSALEGASPKDKAKALMDLYTEPNLSALIDISGGDLASELMDFLDLERLQGHSPIFYGYSDLTVLLNVLPGPCIYQQPLNYWRKEQGEDKVKKAAMQAGFCAQVGQRPDMTRTPYLLPLDWQRGGPIEGPIVGGTLRCLLKLAGTPYFPELRDKILFLEAYSGEMERCLAYFFQLKQMGVLRDCKGLLLGQFTQLEAQGPGALEQVLERACVHEKISRCSALGHAFLSSGMELKRPVSLSEEGVCPL